MTLPPILSAIALPALLLASCAAAPEGPVAVGDHDSDALSAGGAYINWLEHVIDDEESSGGVPLRGADGLVMGDLDGDGHEDIVAAHEDSGHIRVCYGSDDPDEWFRLSLAEGEEARGVEHVDLGDLNGDGRLDVVAACEHGHLLYLENPGRPGRGFRWARVIPEATKNRGSFIKVFTADFDGDGRAEVVAANKGRPDGERDGVERNISWFEIPENPLDGEGWKEHVLARVKGPINSHTVDLDGDGDIDIVAGARDERRIFWFENVTDGEIAFKEHPILIEGTNPGGEPAAASGFNLYFHDFNEDGRLDILAATAGELLSWLEQPAEKGAAWALNPIGGFGPDSMTGFAAADINGDGRADVIAGSYSLGPRLEDGEEVTANDRLGRIAWFESPSDPAGRWTRHDIVRRKRGMFDAFIPRDMDGDGDIDFVATRGNSGEFDGLFWLEQRRAPVPVKAFDQARDKDSRLMPLPAKE